MKKTVWISILIIAGLTVAQIGIGNALNERSNFAISVSPEEIAAAPGSTVRRSLNIVTGNLVKSARFAINVMDIGQDPEGGTIMVERGEGTRSCADWITITDLVTVAPPGGTTKIDYSIKFPPMLVEAIMPISLSACSAMKRTKTNRWSLM